jgi:hypothetical protein
VQFIRVSRKEFAIVRVFHHELLQLLGAGGDDDVLVFAFAQQGMGRMQGPC